MTDSFTSDSSYADLGAVPASLSTPSAPFEFHDQSGNSSSQGADATASNNNSASNTNHSGSDLGSGEDEDDLVNLPSTIADSGLLSGDLGSNSSGSLAIYQQRPTMREIAVSCAINCILPFINGMMLGFGEIFAHEIGYRWGWSAARVRRPSYFLLFFLFFFFESFESFIKRNLCVSANKDV